MIINFNILNRQINLTDILEDPFLKDWWFKNGNIDVNKNSDDLTEEDKIKLVKLAIYEGWLDSEELCNLPNKCFKIN